MPIVGDGQLNLAALTVNDVYVVIRPPQTPLIPGIPTDGIGIVGTAKKGEPNKPTLVGNPEQVVTEFGQLTTSTYDLVTEIIGAMKQGANNIYGVRVTDGTEVKASGSFVDDSSGPGVAIIGLTAKTPGSWGNDIVANIGVGSNNTATPATGAVTVAGTWDAADTATITVWGTAITYTCVAGDTPLSIATALIALINGDATVSRWVRASMSPPTPPVSSAVITITAVTQGDTGNSITVVGSETSLSGTVTEANGTLLNGAGQQTFKFTVRAPGEVTEIFDNVSGVDGQGAGSAAAALVNVINNGVTSQRGPSRIVSAALTGGGTGNLSNQQVGLTAGTDGTAGVSGIHLMGIDGPTLDRTGMYTLRGLPIAQFGLAGMTDVTTWPTQLEFAVSENILAVLGLPAFTDTQSAVQIKQQGLIDDWRCVPVKDFLYLNDTVNGKVRLVSPIGAVLGKIATLSPERSPGNKPIYGYLGTERTGYVGANGSFQSGIPYSFAEVGLLTSNGVMFITSPSVGGNFMACRHGLNAATDPTRNGINYTRMTQFLARSFLSAMGFAIDQVHTPALRRRVKSAIEAFLQSLAQPGPGRDPMIGDSSGGLAYSVICDNTNNPQALVDQGYMFVTTQVKYFAIVRFFVIQLEAGQGVTVRVQGATSVIPAVAA